MQRTSATTREGDADGYIGELTSLQSPKKIFEGIWKFINDMQFITDMQGNELII